MITDILQTAGPYVYVDYLRRRSMPPNRLGLSSPNAVSSYSTQVMRADLRLILRNLGGWRRPVYRIHTTYMLYRRPAISCTSL